VPAGLTGTGQTIAVVDAPGTGDVADDLNTFSSYYGLPQCNGSNACFQLIDLSGGAAVPSNNDWGGEIALDTQMVHAIAPGAKIVLVIAASGSGSDLMSAINYAAGLAGVTAVSMSFDASAATYQGAEDPLLSGFVSNHGLIFFASSGDNGGFSPLQAYPATSPYVTSVGGTRITSVDWSNPGSGEVAWQFSGGGNSLYSSMPSWQSAILSAALVTANGSKRAVPDVSAVADFQYSAFGVYHRESWGMYGGTSASAPLWAGISALFGQYLANKSQSLATLIKATPGGFNGLLYQSNVAQGSAFHDVVSGSNNLTSTPAPLCSAGTGFDDVTGLGAPDVANLFSVF
jgi:subtilase family serine protease